MVSQLKQVLCILTLFLIFLSLPFPTFASTLTPSVPWGARNSYTAFDGSGWDAFFNVSFPDFGPGVDIYQGTDGTARVGPYSAPYPQDPTAYFTGFTAGQTITFRTTITNTSSKPGRDNFWFSVSRVIDCPGFSLSSSTLTEQNLYDCSVEGNRIITNQRLIFWSPALTYHDPNCETGIDGKFCLNISNIAPDNTATLTYTWTPQETGYYQFDFGSDDYGHDFPDATAYAAGFIRVISPPPPPPPPPPPGNKSCSITSVSSSTVSFSGWGNTSTAETVKLWLEKKDGTEITNTPIPRVDGNPVTATFDPDNSKYYYRLDSEGDCRATSTSPCSATKAITLPMGDYWVHCDLETALTSPSKICSGNPFCSYNNSWSNAGTINCGDYISCSNTDHASLTVTPPAPVIGDLTVKEDIARGGAVGTTYGISGLRADDPILPNSGNNYYNSLIVTQNITDSANATLEGIAFTANSGTYTSLSSLMSSAGLGTGNFILLYATTGCTPSCTTGGYTFYPDNHYVYFNGVWNGPISTYVPYISSGNIRVSSAPDSASANPKFSVTFYKNLNSHNWGTYGYVMNKFNQTETVVSEQACNEARTSCY